MKQLLKAIYRDVLKASNALTYAELGEHWSESQKSAVLDAAASGAAWSEAASAQTRAVILPPRKHVAHVTTGDIRPGALQYAINVSQRMDADLDILSPPGAQHVEQSLDRYRADLDQAGVHWRWLREQVANPGDVAAYAHAHRDVLFIVISAQDALARLIESGRATLAPCEIPWVLVADGRTPA